MKIEDYGTWTEVTIDHPRYGSGEIRKFPGYLTQEEVEAKCPYYYQFKYVRHGKADKQRIKMRIS